MSSIGQFHPSSVAGAEDIVDTVQTFPSGLATVSATSREPLRGAVAVEAVVPDDREHRGRERECVARDKKPILKQRERQAGAQDRQFAGWPSTAKIVFADFCRCPAVGW